MTQCLDKDGVPNLVDVIALSRRWSPLVRGEKMTVRFESPDGKTQVYEIKRIK